MGFFQNYSRYKGRCKFWNMGVIWRISDITGFSIIIVRSDRVCVHHEALGVQGEASHIPATQYSCTAIMHLATTGYSWHSTLTNLGNFICKSCSMMICRKIEIEIYMKAVPGDLLGVVNLCYHCNPCNTLYQCNKPLSLSLRPIISHYLWDFPVIF